MAGLLMISLIAFNIIFVLVISGIYIYAKITYSYFKKRGIPFDTPTFPFGSFTTTVKLKNSFSSALANMYANNKNHKLVGYFFLWQKKILINEPETIRQVLVKDFDVFQDRGTYYNKEKDPLSAHLFSLEGEEWRNLRIKLTPTFSSGKIKGMFPIIVNCSKGMTDHIATTDSEHQSVDCQKLFFCFGLSVISNTAFGLESDAFTNKDSMFVKMTRRFLAPTISRMLIMIMMMNSKLASKINLGLVPSDVSDFFMKVFKDTIEFREKTGVYRNDYLQLLMQLKSDTVAPGSDVSLSDNELAAEAFVFILGGSETTSSAMSFCLQELAINPLVQAKLHEEVDSLQEITYESINELEYLSMVIDETLRKYPPLGFLTRECSRDYLVPGTNTVIEKGTQVFVSVQGLHNDPDLFPDPEQFIPERFSRENKSNIKPYSYMPFGEGPRFCIGMRFAKITMMTGLVVLLRHYQVHPNPSAPAQIQLDAKTITTTAVGGIWLHLRKRNSGLEIDHKNE